MEQLGPSHMPEITEENLAESQARMRALILNRYELIWNVIEARIREDRDEVRPLDPRLLEIGRGILREEALLFRLSKPPTIVEEDPDQELTLTDRRELVAASLDELEAKRRAQDEAAKERAAAAQAARDQAAEPGAPAA